MGDILYLYSATEQGTTRLTLRETGNSYHIVALQPMVNGEAVDGEFVTVAALFDTLLSSPADATKAGDYIKAHPNEHVALLTDENLTLRYIFTEFLKDDQPEPKGQVMRLILDELAPEAQLRLHTETGQEYFDEWIKGADQMVSDHGLEWMQHNQPNMYMALQLRSDIYGHSSPVIPIDAPELPEPFDLDTVTYRAACDAILASLSTGWWTGQDLNPAKEAAAFTCFYHETVGDELNLYGFGGYFSQDAQGNDDLSWCDFTLVTLDASTLQPISVWWPGDSAAHVMSIDEVFPSELAQAANMSEDYQKLHKQLKKQAAENMVDAGLSLPAAQTRVFKRDGLTLEISGVRAVRQMNMVAEGIALHQYAVFVCDPNATITVLNADLDDPAYAEDGLPHPNWGLLYEDDTHVRITEETGTVPITPDLRCVYHLEASLSVLDFEIVE